MGAAVTAVQQATKELHLPASIATSFQGPAQAFQASLSGTPILILAAMIVVYIILGMLYESTIHPITIISTLPSALGYAIVGGLLVSQVLTLFTTPVVYIYMDRLGKSLRRLRGSRRALAEAPAAGGAGE